MSEPRDRQYMILSVMLAANTLAVLAVLAALVFGFQSLRSEMHDTICEVQGGDVAAVELCKASD